MASSYPAGLVRDVLRICLQMLESLSSEEIAFESEDDLRLFLLSLLMVVGAVADSYEEDGEGVLRIISRGLIHMIVEDIHGDGEQTY